MELFDGVSKMADECLGGLLVKKGVIPEDKWGIRQAIILIGTPFSINLALFHEMGKRNFQWLKCVTFDYSFYVFLHPMFPCLAIMTIFF